MRPYAYRRLNALAYRTVCELGLSSWTKIMVHSALYDKNLRTDEIIILIYVVVNLYFILYFPVSWDNVRQLI